MDVDARPIAEWRSRWKWFKLGPIVEIETFPRVMVGLGFIAFEAHLFSYPGGVDVDAYVSSPLGYVGVHFEFIEKEEPE